MFAPGKMRSGILAVSLVWALGGIACAMSDTHGPGLFTAFEDFDFVGSEDPGDQVKTIVGILEGAVTHVQPTKLPTTTHGSGRKPIPGDLKTGVVYVFHSSGKVDEEDIALRILPQRFRRMGVRIISGPKSRNDLVFLVIGGPLFRFKFEHNGRGGYVWNTYDSRYDLSDYLLLYVR
jgi:hypothetical protein